MNTKLKIYTFNDGAFFFKATFIAENINKARKMAGEKSQFYIGHLEITEHPIKPGFVCEAGGNG